jgi:5'(3')-deoxyribonucleotidase
MRVLLDVDGVIADFVSGYLSAVKRATGRDYLADQITGFDIPRALRLAAAERQAVEQAVSRPGYCQELGEYPGAVAAVEQIARVHEVVFVTGQWSGSPTWTSDREQWLRSRFGELGRNVVHTQLKHVVSGDVLVDDNLDNCAAWAAAHQAGTAIVWSRPWNRRQEPPTVARMSDWQRLLAWLNAR